MDNEQIYLEILGDIYLGTIEGDTVDINAGTGSIKAVNKNGTGPNVTGREIRIQAYGDIGEKSNYLLYILKEDGTDPIFISDTGKVYAAKYTKSRGGGGSGGFEARDDGRWIQEDYEIWRYRYTDEKGDKVFLKDAWGYLNWQGVYYWYHFDKNSIMQYGWYRNANGEWYYLSVLHDGWFGHMLTGWQFIDGFWYYFTTDVKGSEGRMATGWYLIDGKWYYFETREDVQGRPQGSLYMNSMTPDGYRVGTDGAWINSGKRYTDEK